MGGDRANVGAETEFALADVETEGGVIAGDGNVFRAQCRKRAINDVEIEEGDFVNFGRHGPVLCAFEIRSIGREGREVIHALVKTRVGCDFDHIRSRVVPQDIFPRLGVS